LKVIAGVAIGLVVIGAALQAVNHRAVHSTLCEWGECDSKGSLLSFDLEIDSKKLPQALSTVKPPRTKANVALLRRGCDGQWMVAFGVRLDIGPWAVGKQVDFEPGCVDAFRQSVHVLLAGAQVRYDQCVARLDPVSVGWTDALTARVIAQVAPEAVDGCASLLPADLGAAAARALVARSVALDVRYSLPYGRPNELSDGSAASPSSAGGWVRRGLARMETVHDLKVTLPGGSASLQVASKPDAATAGSSPQLAVTLSAEGSVLSLLPEHLKQTLAHGRPLRIRWNLDHESGRVFVNDQAIQRVAPAPRPPGPTRLQASECGTTFTAAAPALYFVEAGDRGEPQNPQQVQAVFRALDEANVGAGALVAVFVHGWQHSAAPGDSYACDYAKLISAVEGMENHAARAVGRPPRKVIGVYVGWPGNLYANEIANATTFWNRLQTADRLGDEGALLRQLIPGLAQRVATRGRDPRADRRSALVVTGHSLGGRAVFHAMRTGLTSTPGSAPTTAAPDLVLLVNPAFSAEIYRAIHERELQCQPIGLPLLSFSSRADSVTRQVYPAGQAVTFDRAAPKPAPFPEHVYTAANFREFVTHELRMELLRGEAPRPDGEQSILRGFLRAPLGSNELYSDNPVTVYRQPQSGHPRPDDAWYRMSLEGVSSMPARCPASRTKVIEVDPRIIPDHGTIFTPPFMEYVVRTLNRAALGAGGVPRGG
jgi:hypothetical protein